jgi:2-polyprenyl-3-methyl-5-hydroxy-6-metoxy-1,4-benzoquinol methylase
VCGVTDWAGGYVTDVEYIPGFYRQQSPPQLELAALLGGVDSRLPAGTEQAHYLELGCGRGMNAVTIAAANPAWRVTAVDYNPAHIAFGMALAHEAALDNITFIEADFGALAQRDLPQADIVSLHGIWSWVGLQARAAIVRLLAAVVSPGGLVHLSYNSLPAWQGLIGLQRLVFEAGHRSAGRSDRQVRAGFAFVQEMHQAEALHLRANPLAGELLGRLASLSTNYLAHEYMNTHWSPCFHSDVAAAMAEAKLDWAGSANLLETFPDLMLTPEQRVLFERQDDPVMQETVKDFCISRQLRHDLFVRGARRLSSAQRDAALGRLVLALRVPAAEFSYDLTVPAGNAGMGATYRDHVAALQAGPASVASLLATISGQGNPAELAGLMVGTNQAVLMPRPDAVQAPGADRLNRVLGRRITSLAGPEVSGVLAATRLATGLPATRIMQFVCARALDGEDAGAFDSWFQQLCRDIPEENHATLREMLRDAAEVRLPLMRSLGLVG